ncbi:MAG TPA: alpha/beta hydrolase, partial [Acidimicrobiia bacterium]|nr:alpha/beta hydrolase [Acidimicrobiia bacterium]
MSTPEMPETQYARSGDLSIAYQVLGDGPMDVVFVSGFVSHQELGWELGFGESIRNRLSAFARYITFDKRGTGLSDRDLGFGSAEDRMDDIRAVMDAVGSERAVLWVGANATAIAVLFAATYPERCAGLAL